MTTDHQGKYAELVAKARAHVGKHAAAMVSDEAGAASARAAPYITNAVKEAKALGLEITEEEAHAYFWMMNASYLAPFEMQAIYPRKERAVCFPNYYQLLHIRKEYDTELKGVNPSLSIADIRRLGGHVSVARYIPKDESAHREAKTKEQARSPLQKLGAWFSKL